MFEFEVVVKRQVVIKGKTDVVLHVLLHDDLVALVIATAVDKVALLADTGVLALMHIALLAQALAIAIHEVTPLAGAQPIAFDALALHANAVTTTVRLFALVTVHEIILVKTTVGIPLASERVEKNDVGHDIKKRTRLVANRKSRVFRILIINI